MSISCGSVDSTMCRCRSAAQALRAWRSWPRAIKVASSRGEDSSFMRTLCSCSFTRQHWLAKPAASASPSTLASLSYSRFCKIQSRAHILWLIDSHFYRSKQVIWCFTPAQRFYMKLFSSSSTCVHLTPDSAKYIHTHTCSMTDWRSFLYEAIQQHHCHQQLCPYHTPDSAKYNFTHIITSMAPFIWSYFPLSSRLTALLLLVILNEWL